MIRFVVVACVVVALSGCAVGRASPDCEVWGVAVGSSKVECCEAAGRCASVQGGKLSSGFVDFLDQALVVVGAWFGLGAIGVVP